MLSSDFDCFSCEYVHEVSKYIYYLALEILRLYFFYLPLNDIYSNIFK